MIPRATYRLQLHAGFTFDQAAALAPYLADLGVSHVYASPITTARQGSMHGYDVIDPTRINPELGGEDGFKRMVLALRREGLGVILDIVPNHMAVGGDDNRWWLDVLEAGEDSAHAAFFDIDWRPADEALQGKILAPFLGVPYAEALSSGAIVLEHDPDGGRLAAVAHGVHRFPIRREDYADILAAGAGGLSQRYDPTTDDGRGRLHDLLERQNYRLAWWRTAGDEINWRRFFDITELAGVRVERPEVFDTVHGLALSLYAQGWVDGVRVDHVDGLADPAGYARALRERLDGLTAQRPAAAPGGPAYFVVEKILAQGERMSSNWGTDGTTGYDYMNEVSALLHAPEGAEPLARHWASLSGRTADFAPEERAARLEITERNFAGQLDAAVRAFARLARSDLATRDVAAGALRRALIALLGAFPVYRTYGLGDRAPASDGPILQRAIEAATPHLAAGDAGVLGQIVDWLQAKGPGDPGLAREAARRFQQLSAPVSAKAVEDTAFYRYGRLLSRNDVGFDPGRFSAAVDHHHHANAERRTSFPHAMLTTASHDHKRGEDVRARLAVLSERPDRWIEESGRWTALNRGLGASIDPGDEYMLYQTLVGAWPLGLRADDREGLTAFADRVGGWQQKALREAKLKSSWTAPDDGYEADARRFLQAALDPARSPDFLQAMTGFVDSIAPAGALNGLVQAALRCTAPGMPDLYQGCEFWDLSLVDPDNRRPVDFAARATALAGASDPADLMAHWRDGRLKQALIARILRLRRTLEPVFNDGDYLPLESEGLRAANVVAFVRRTDRAAVLVAAPLRCAGALVGVDGLAPPADWWGDTRLVRPDELAGFVDDDGRPLAPSLRLGRMLFPFPVAIQALRAP